MNFLTKIIKPKDGEPQLKQAHTGQALAARYDEDLKRWIFPGEVGRGELKCFMFDYVGERRSCSRACASANDPGGPVGLVIGAEALQWDGSCFVH
jgi:hypothetical protein